MEWGVGGSFKREGTYVSLWLIQIVFWKKPTQHCKTIILQLKITLKKMGKEIFLKDSFVSGHKKTLLI